MNSLDTFGDRFATVPPADPYGHLRHRDRPEVKAERSGVPLYVFEAADAAVAPVMRDGTYKGLVPPWLTRAQSVETFWQAWSALVSSVDHYHEFHMWRGWLERIGWAGIDGMPDPPFPLRMYRGATEDYADGPSWTTSHATACIYAEGDGHEEPGQVWVALVEPRRMLAGHRANADREFVIDARGLRITPSKRVR